MYDTLEEILMVKVLRRAQIRLSVTMCGHAVTRWVVVTKGNAVFAVGQTTTPQKNANTRILSVSTAIYGVIVRSEVYSCLLRLRFPG